MSNDIPVRERRAYAYRLLTDSQFDLATDEYLWLWDNMHTEVPSLNGVRLTAVAQEIKYLTDSSDKARVAFHRLLILRATQLRSEPSVEAAREWLQLAVALQHLEEVVQWYVADRGQAHVDEAAKQCRMQLFEAFGKAARWDLAIGVLGDHRAFVEALLAASTEAQKFMRRNAVPSGYPVRREVVESMTRQCANVHVGLLQVGQDSEAEWVAMRASAQAGDSALGIPFVEAALAAACARAFHRELLSAAARAGAKVDGLIVDLQKALGDNRAAD